MRTLSSGALAEIAKRQGTEPITIIDIQWAIGGQFFRYGDRDFPGIMGKILEVSPLDEVIQVSSNASSAEISFKLDDTDGTIKAIIDSNDVHLRTVRVYQWFSDLSISDAFLVFEGQLNSPLTWNESERTFSGNVVSKLEDVEIGFSPEEGYNFDWISDEYFDKPWPLAFGKIKYLPGQLVYKIPQGQTTKPLSLADSCSKYKLQYEQFKAANDIRNIQASLLMRFNEGTIRQSAFFETDRTTEEAIIFQNGINEARSQASNQANSQVTDIQTRMNAEIEKYNSDRASEKDYGIQVGHIINGRNFPQGRLLTLKIDEATFTGYFNGDNFITASAANPIKCSQPTFSLRVVTGDNFVVYDENNTLQGYGFYDATEVVPIDESKLGSNYKFIEAGATVEVISDQREIYIVNIVESTVQNVYGYKGVNNIKQLVPLPTSYYKVYHKNINNKYKVCVVELNRPLSSYDEGWSNDGIFVNLTSSVGPNTSDIMKWLIETYTTYTADPTMFATLKTQLTNYPSHFAYFDRRPLLTALQEIAWQCRSRIWLDNGVFKVQYLSTEPSSVDTVTADDIIFGTMVLDYTPTEDIVTKLIAKWKSDYSQTEPNKTTIRYNVAKYGVHEQEYDFYIYNIASLVEKSAVFWTIRYGNTWKLATFKTFLTKLKIETFDAVTINLPMYANVSITALVESSTYDSSDSSVELRLWLPVKAGEMTKYDFSWPADVSVNVKWPKVDEQYAASTTAGSNANGGTFNLNTNRNNTVGGGSGGSGISSFTRRPTGDDNETTPPDSPAEDADTTTSQKASTPGVVGGYVPNYTDGYENIKDYYPVQSISRIDIRTTQIVDSLNSNRDAGYLFHVLRVAGEGKTALFKDALMANADASVIGQMHFKYDTNKSSDAEKALYRPSGTFLKDENELTDLQQADNE